MITSGVRAAQREKVRVCAYGEVFSVHLPSRSWQLPLKLSERKKRESKRAREQESKRAGEQESKRE